MPFHNSRLRKRMAMALLVAIALVLSYFERFIPLTFIMPGLKLGLANIVTLAGLLMFGWIEVLAIVLVRVTMMAFFTGSMISFFYSLVGGLFSLAVMGLVLKSRIRVFSLAGVSMLGAAAHNTGQVLVLAAVTGSFRVALWWLPFLWLAGLATGFFTGLIALNFYAHWQKIRPHQQF